MKEPESIPTGSKDQEKITYGDRLIVLFFTVQIGVILKKESGY